MKKTIFVIIGLIALIYVGKCTYQTLSISSTIPVIKEYTCNGNVDFLIANIKKYVSAHPSISFKVTGVVGDKDSGLGYQITISFKSNNHDLTYDIKCEDNKMKDKVITTLKIIAAHDLTSGTGGYGVKADGMSELINSFTSAILTPMQYEQNIKVTPL
ncbi:hypothetical protein KXD93_30485 [Mucilaginibacter sp. BJC16-A38]|uniref:hypothetical protein n=1 Tax=Mucilaginibacter phenanthrenivorans TaxID=1234842 RepID=UPI0021574E2B|nr:hypothetical protein [Mucilaginibacter phenanthrenivorans]MCR8562021.1 hypothetical protein [Mucilaginibacter phenanthrenivorans]